MESVHEIQSSIRRKRGTESGFTFEAAKYLTSRKNMKKMIQKALGIMKLMKIDVMVSSENKENDMLSMLKEAEALTVRTLQSLLHFIYPKIQSKQSKWSAISKLMQPKRVICDSKNSDTNEFEKVDGALKSLITQKPTSSIDNFQSHMEDLEMCIQDLEVGVECLSRQLIKTRVSLLNIFNH